MDINVKDMSKTRGLYTSTVRQPTDMDVEEQWCLENIGKLDWFCSWKSRQFVFRYEEDLILFTLRWE